MTLADCVLAVENWQAISPIELFEKLNEPTFRYVDKKSYRLVDIAKLIGDENMQMFLDVVKISGYEWMISETAVGTQLGDDPINARLRALNHPVATMLANHTNRIVSILERAGITATIDEVQSVQKALLLNADKKMREKAAQDRTQAYREKLTLWPGFPEPPPEL
jgi:hypothetical protein